MIKTENKVEKRIVQGDIISNVEVIESVSEDDGVLKISKIVFPNVLVITQDCDLTWDYDSRNNERKTQDKFLFSVIVLPLYVSDQLMKGEHLSNLNQNMQSIEALGKTAKKNVEQNQNPRYHFLDFSDDIPLAKTVIDFKHYFTVNIDYLQKIKEKNYVCTISPLFREQISQRFAYYLSRIGLPEIIKDDKELL